MNSSALIAQGSNDDKFWAHTVAIWTFPFHQNSVKKSDDFQDLTLAQYNLKKSYFWLMNMKKKVLCDERRV